MRKFIPRGSAVPVVLLAAGLGLIVLASCDGKSGDGAADAVEKAGRYAETVHQALDAQDLMLVKDVARIAAAIDETPGKAAAILEENGMTRERYDEMLAKIEGSEKLKAAYEKARASF